MPDRTDNVIALFRMHVVTPGAAVCRSFSAAGAGWPRASRPDQRNGKIVREVPVDPSDLEKPAGDDGGFELAYQGRGREPVASGQAVLHGGGTHGVSGVDERRAGL